MAESKAEYFDKNYQNYDQWYEDHPIEFSEQLDFISSLLPDGSGIEIGVGTGRFASALGIEKGVDISSSMARLATERGVDAIVANAENLPFVDKEFDYSLNMVTICFLDNPLKSLIEARRVSKLAVTVILDRECEYVSEIIKKRRGFYRYAIFYTRDELVDLYRKAGFSDIVVKEKDLRTKEGLSYKLVGVIGS